MRMRFGLAVYYAAVFLLITCSILIVTKLLFWVPCVPDGPKGTICTVDSWSIAGLAATVLGVAATILAVLGAFAVAAWWTELDKRVSKQVTTLFDEQKADVNKQVDALLDEQKKKVIEQEKRVTEQERQISEQEKKMDQQIRLFESKFVILDGQTNMFSENIDTLRQLADGIIELALSTATINPPWEIEEWAANTMSKFKIPRVAELMVFKYLSYVDSLLSPNSSDIIRHTSRLDEQRAPTNLLYYWNAALRWQQVLSDYYQGIEELIVATTDSSSQNVSFQEPEALKEVREKIDMYIPKVEDWKQRHGLRA